MNPFQSLYDAQNHGTAEQKHASLPDFPRLIDVELTNTCNFRCLMCPTGNHSMQRKSGFMDERTMYGIIAQCAPHETAIRWVRWGEPTLHPQLVSFVRAATEVGLLTHINTNGSKMTYDLACDLVDAGLSSIKFSFQGVDAKSYAEMRNVDFFDGMIEAINTMLDARGEGNKLPFIAASTSITYETPEMVGAFKKRLGHLVDHLSIGHTVFDYMDLNAVRLRPHEKEMLERLSKLQSVEKKHPDPCPQVFDSMSINWDGSVSVCCNDFDNEAVVGKFPEKSLKELWTAPLFKEYRERLARKEYGGPLCTNCYDYQGMTDAAA